MAVDVDAGRDFRVATPRPLFETKVDPRNFEFTPYDVTADGERFIFADRDDVPWTELRVVLNWDKALER